MVHISSQTFTNNGRYNYKITVSEDHCIPSISLRRVKKLAKKEGLYLKGSIRKNHPKWTNYINKMNYNKARKVLWINKKKHIMTIVKPLDAVLAQLPERSNKIRAEVSYIGRTTEMVDQLESEFKYRCYFV